MLIPNNVFKPRNKLSISKDEKTGKWMLYFRSYNASRLDAVLVKFECYIRQAKFSDSAEGKDCSIANKELETEGTSGNPPVMTSPVPHSVKIELLDEDIKFEDEDLQRTDTSALKSIQGKSFQPELGENGTKHPGESFLVVVIRGWLPDLGSEFVEMKYYRLSGPKDKLEFAFEDFQHIDVLPPADKSCINDDKPELWEHWEKFDSDK